MKILVFGGDERQIFVSEYLTDMGCSVDTFAIDDDRCKSRAADYSGYDVMIFPLPFSVDGRNINCPLCDKEFTASEVFKRTGRNSRMFVGMAGAYFKAAAREFGADLFDYYECEELQIKNSVPTAEGAIWTYMNNSKKTVFESDVAVAGCGKVGRCLADRLLKLGANVTVAARGKKDIAWAESLGMTGVEIERFITRAYNADCIFNTVPCNIFDRDFVSGISDKTLYIELASKPYGMSAECSALLGERCVVAPSLPGRTAPLSAGKIIAETLYKYL